MATFSLPVSPTDDVGQQLQDDAGQGDGLGMRLPHTPICQTCLRRRGWLTYRLGGDWSMCFHEGFRAGG